MSKKIIYSISGFLFLFLFFYAGKFYYNNLRGIGPVLSNPPELADPTTSTPTSNSSSTIVHDANFNVPDGFAMALFAKNLPNARVIIFDSTGNLWVSQTSKGLISKITIENGKNIKQTTALDGLRKPHGIAFDPSDPNILYIAEETKISKTTINGDNASKLEKIIDLPSGGVHTTRSLIFGNDGKLYVSIGSTCNACRESDDRRAAIWSLNKDGSDFKEVAKGLRNSVFMTLKNGSDSIWATDMGRDLLGDDTPPEEINIIATDSKEIQNFGWPICYGKNIHDSVFDKNIYIRNPCMEPFEKPSFIDMQAHSAPLGLTFIPKNTNWPSEYKNSLLVAFHGSWNRSVPTGYKVVSLVLNDKGEFEKQEDFITGFLKGRTAIGRPVALAFDKNGTLFLSDDKAGAIYQIKFQK